MRMLQVSHNHHIVGGSDRMFFETSALLEKAGHEVIPFCLNSSFDQPSKWSGFFPRGADTANPSLRDTMRYFYNFDARICLDRLLEVAGSIDVAHLHIYHGKLTPSILPVLKSRGIPIVQTLHEYKMACPVYTMLRHGRNCDACVEGSNLNSIRHRCKDKSVVKSAIMAAEMKLSRMLGDVNLVDRFICVSEFQRDIMIRAGLPEKKLVTLHNFVRSSSEVQCGDTDDYFLFFGRIETLKGLPTLLDAVAQSRQRLLIVGDGSWKPEMLKRVHSQPNVDYMGFKDGVELATLIARAKAVVVPSEWYENCPMSILEAKAMGRPVIAANIGGIPELVRDGVDGFLFRSGDPVDLCKALDRFKMASHQNLSQNALLDVAQRFSSDVHLTALLGIYKSVSPEVDRVDNPLSTVRSNVDPQAFAMD